MYKRHAEISPPEVPEPTVGSDLLQPLKIFSQLVVQTVSKDLQHNNSREDTGPNRTILLIQTPANRSWE